MTKNQFSKEDILRARSRVWEGTKKTEFKSVGDTLAKKLEQRQKKALASYSKYYTK